MPHFGLMDERNMTEEDALLMRTRLHLRSGRRRLREGKLVDGVAVLYDAVHSAMQWAALTADWWAREGANRKDELLTDELLLYDLLKREGCWHESLDFRDFRALLEQAMDGELPPDFDHVNLLKGVEALMTTFGVIPFDENELPPEKPGTF